MDCRWMRFKALDRATNLYTTVLQYPAAIRYQEESQIIIKGDCNTTQKNQVFLFKKSSSLTKPAQ
jgi:hypothetical protein